MSSAATSAHDEIRTRIVSGALPPGSRLREAQLVTDLGVSRTPIREALRRLHAEGLVTILPNRGARVASWSEQDLEDVFALRLVVEAYAVRRAAERIRPPDISRLEALATAMEGHLAGQQGDWVAAIADLNNEFHQLITLASESKAAIPVLGTLVSIPGRGGGSSQSVQMPLGRRAVFEYTAQQLERSAREHRELIAALRQGDSEWAEAIVRTHTLGSRGAVRSRRDAAARSGVGS
jgi:DNA-binding GntR family transcriptional regulator